MKNGRHIESHHAMPKAASVGATAHGRGSSGECDVDATVLTSYPNSIDGVPVVSAAAPDSVEEAGEAIRGFVNNGQAVFPFGGGTSLGFGRPPSRTGAILDTRKLSRIIDYPSEDMTVTVEAGIRLAELATALAEKGQMLPVDAAHAEQATLGGLIAINGSGPRRFGYGTLRDYVLGIDFLNAEGNRVHGGGRVVKNVAGYDMMKLQIGALGTLGVVTQVTLKLKPLPEAQAAVTASLKPDEVEPALALLGRTVTRPTAVDLLNRPAAAGIAGLALSPERPWGLVLLFEDSASATAWQVREMVRELSEIGITAAEVAREEYGGILGRLTAFPADAEASLVFKASLLPGRLVEFCQRTEDVIAGVRLAAHAANGIVYGAMPDGVLSSARPKLEQVRLLAAEAEGSLILQRCPTDWKSDLSVWGPPRGDWELMRRLKRKLDPADVFNPGRIV